MDPCIDGASAADLSSGCRDRYCKPLDCVRRNGLSVSAIATSAPCRTCIADPCEPFLLAFQGV